MLRNQGGGPNQILLEFTFEFTKDFLGAKDVYVVETSLLGPETSL